MPISPRATWRHRCVAVALLSLGGSVAAAPGAADDTLAELIAERGWVAEPPVRAAPAGADAMLRSALSHLGVAYRRGGDSADEGFDCSGFTRHVFAAGLGLELPRRADEQAGAADLVRVRRDDLAPGDLVFFNTLRRTFSHVGIYLGEGRFIHAPRTGSAVRIEDMRRGYWHKRFTGARRARSLHAAAPAPRAAATDAETFRLLY